MDDVLRVGDVLHGYCGGEFGRDSYECKRVEAIGADWIVVRNVDRGNPRAAYGPPSDMIRYRDEGWGEGRCCEWDPRGEPNPRY